MQNLQLEYMEKWEFGALQIMDPANGNLKRYYELVIETEKLGGAILELGVARGASLITTGLLLRQIHSARKLRGLDTFAGFPETANEDKFEFFEILLRNGEITEEHYGKAQKNSRLVRLRGDDPDNPESISVSGNFSKTSFDFVQKKLNLILGDLDVKLHRIDFSEGPQLDELLDSLGPISLVLFDSDLYGGYKFALPKVFGNLQCGGWIYLDEYYSLKFPGPRVSVNKFLNEFPSAKLIRLEDHDDFERWAIQKQ